MTSDIEDKTAIIAIKAASTIVFNESFKTWNIWVAPRLRLNDIEGYKNNLWLTVENFLEILASVSKNREYMWESVPADFK